MQQEQYNRLQIRSQLKEFGFIVGSSPAMQQIAELIETVALSDSLVHICGETGTGKEKVAEALHRLSPRSAKPMIVLNCAGISETLAGSELFGHIKGAFTGAISNRKGKFALAQNGTLFLDEVADLPPPIQVKLLRVLDKGDYWQEGGDQQLKTNARILTATNKDLSEEVKAGRFREDLYYRLNKTVMELPPLRARGGRDITDLAEHFLEKICRQQNKSIKQFSFYAIRQMVSYDWPGNIRELEGKIEGVVSKRKATENGDVTAIELFEETQVKIKRPFTPLIEGQSLPDAVANFEVELVKKALVDCNGNKTHAAKALGIKKHQLDHMIRVKYKIIFNRIKVENAPNPCFHWVW